MILGENRQAYRQFFFDVWGKNKNQVPLSPVETQLLNIIELHPEYHFIFQNPEHYQEQEFFAELSETNPFLHMALHLALLEQLEIDLPKGIREYYIKLRQHHSSTHEIEHCLMSALAEALNDAQRHQRPFSNEYYFQLIKNFLDK